MRRLIALLAVLAVAAAESCEWADSYPVSLGSDEHAYRFSLHNIVDGTPLSGFPAGGRGGLELTFPAQVEGFALVCALHTHAQFSADNYERTFWIDLPPRNATGFELCSIVLSELPLLKARLYLEAGCPAAVPPAPTTTPPATTAAAKHRLERLLAFLLRQPAWVYVCVGVVLASIVLMFAALWTCVRAETAQQRLLREHYTPLDDREGATTPPPSPQAEELPESLAPRRLLLPFRAFMGLRCGSLFCMVLSSRTDDADEAVAEAQPRRYPAPAMSEYASL